jgi:peptidoglycan/LPS O-acetylase OafA/YrhL
LAALALPNGRYVVPLFASYFTVYLGLLNPPRNRLVLGGDYSYGLYLYGYPIQQAVAAFPQTREWWINLAISLPLAIVFAAGSWHLLEKRVLKLRTWVMRMEDGLVWVGRRIPRPSLAPRPASQLNS